MQIPDDPNRRRMIQAVGCLGYLVGAAVVAGLAGMVWRIV